MINEIHVHNKKIKQFIIHHIQECNNTKIGRRTFFMNKLNGEITTQLLKQGLLCKSRTLSSAAPIGLNTYHQHNFSLLGMIY